MVKRFFINQDVMSDNYAEMEEDLDGDFVEHSDYITLENKYKKLKERVEDLTTSFNINPNFFFDSDE